MKSILANHRIIFITTVSLFVTASQALAQKPEAALTFPGNRYIGAPGASGSLAYWDGPIVPEAIGDKDQTKTILESIASLLFYARSAGADVKIGDKGISNTSNKAVRPNANYLIAFTEKAGSTSAESPEKHSKPTLSDLGIDMSNANTDLLKISRQGLIEQSPGCYARWAVDSSEHVKAMAIAASSNLPEEEKTRCVSNAVISSLGVYPVFNNFHLSLNSSRTSSVFRDKGEVILELEAENFCRKEWFRYDVSCPRSVIKTVLSMNNNIRNK